MEIEEEEEKRGRGGVGENEGEERIAVAGLRKTAGRQGSQGGWLAVAGFAST